MTFLQRAIGAAKLEVPVFEEIEADRTATGQALIIVVLSSLAAGIGFLLVVAFQIALTLGAPLGAAALGGGADAEPGPPPCHAAPDDDADPWDDALL